MIVSLLLANYKEALTGSGVIRQVYDPAAGTGGMHAPDGHLDACCLRSICKTCLCWKRQGKPDG